eukprot:NODE_776_length_3975_cov_0.468008.p3 type:complete len:234 gc:universal NODE_776_length_3975_cov_0.468008:2243-2944(+)
MTLGEQLHQLIAKKQSNLCVSLDLPTLKDVIQVLEWIGNEIVVAKLHIDTYPDFTSELMEQVIKLKHQYNFLLFEDRKFADIGNTTTKQLKGIYNIGNWADLITVHGLPGPGIIKAVHEVNPLLKCLLLVEMSSANNLFNQEYTNSCIQMAKDHPDQVAGIISQHKYENLFTFTPGVALETGNDNLGQQYRTVEQVMKDGTDIIIVGRAIISHYPNKEALISATKAFKSAGFK